MKNSKALTVVGTRECDLQETIWLSAPEIINKLIAKAKEGSYQHAKFLFDLAGIDLQDRPDEEEEEGDLAALLMNEIADLRSEGPRAGA